MAQCIKHGLCLSTLAAAMALAGCGGGSSSDTSAPKPVQCTSVQYVDGGVCKNKATQTITGLTLPALSVGDKATLAAKASSGLAISYSSKTADVCTVAGNQVTAVQAGLCTVVANQAGDAKTLAAAEDELSVLITPVCAEDQHVDADTNLCTANTSEITPLIATQSVKTIFSVSGQKLPLEPTVEVADCSGYKLISRSSTSIRFECTPAKTGLLSVTLVDQKKEVLALYAVNIVAKDSSAVTVNLPSMPANPVETLTGVDVNKNGVRDEVEIGLRQHIAHDGLYVQSLKLAQAYQQILEQPVPRSRDEALKVATKIGCITSPDTGDDDIWHDLTFDTFERKLKFAEYRAVFSGGFLGSELGQCGE